MNLRDLLSVLDDANFLISMVIDCKGEKEFGLRIEFHLTVSD